MPAADPYMPTLVYESSVARKLEICTAYCPLDGARNVSLSMKI